MLVKILKVFVLEKKNGITFEYSKKRVKLHVKPSCTVKAQYKLFIHGHLQMTTYIKEPISASQ